MTANPHIKFLSHVVQYLEGDKLVRYIEKLNILGAEDPYLMPETMFSPLTELKGPTLPNLSKLDIYIFLMNKSPSFTQKSLKAYKSLEAYKYFVAGYVREVKSYQLKANKSHVVMAKVLHSQKPSEPPLRPWVAINEDGSILFAHCTCLEGLGEVCSHVAATCFAVEAFVEMSNATSCTSLPCSWLKPSVSGPVGYAETANINFANPQCQQKCVETEESAENYTPLPPLSCEQAKSFYQRINGTGDKCTVLSVLPQFSNAYIPRGALLENPELLTELLEESCSPNNNLCYCKTVDRKKSLIVCASESCTIKYFHKECQGLKIFRKDWKCQSCTVLERKSMKK